MSLVSIIIPCFNAEKYVADAIKSGLDQTHQDCELIIVDDGSSDGSLEVVNGFQEENITIITQENGGACAARNAGLRAARGEFIQFLDADDVLYNTKVQSHIKELETLDYFPSLTISSYRTENSGTITPINFPSQGAESAFCFMLRNNPQTSSALYPRDWLAKIGGFREDLLAGQERELNLRLALAVQPKIIVVRCPQYLTRKVPGGISRDFTKVLSQFAKMHKPFLGSARLSKFERNEVGKFIVKYGGVALRHQRPEIAEELYNLAERFSFTKILQGRSLDIRLLEAVLGRRRGLRLNSAIRRNLRK